MLNRFFEPAAGNVSHTERLVSTLGGVIAIFATYALSSYFLGENALPLIVPSMGASAVLLFAAPHSPLTQPWNLLGGHVISALVGVTCQQLVTHDIAAASLAVGISIGLMHYLRCIHPPGGATALVAVVGGEQVHALGYQFIVTPVLLNALAMLCIAVLFNYLFEWRRYPASLAAPRGEDPARAVKHRSIDHADLVAALGQIDSFIDVSEDDLLHIYDLATGQASPAHLPAEAILPGQYYSNGSTDEDWSVRQIIDDSPHTDPGRDMVVYKVVAGQGNRDTAVMTRRQFARWARFEMSRQGNDWKQIARSDADATGEDSP